MLKNFPKLATITNIYRHLWQAFYDIYIYKDLLHRNQWKLHIGLQIVPITNLPQLSL